MKTKVLLAVLALSYAPLMVAGNEDSYPKEKVAAFVVEKLDLTSLPSAFRPKKEKGKKTLADYGFTAQSMDENEAIIEAPSGVRGLAIRVLDQNSSGIYVCVAEPGENGGDTKAQSVMLLKRKNPNSLLKGRESFREFAACPVIGGSDFATNLRSSFELVWNGSCYFVLRRESADRSWRQCPRASVGKSNGTTVQTLSLNKGADR